MNSVGKITVAAVVSLLGACGGMEEEASDATLSMNDVSERYVKLILAIGEHEPGYVDAYYGPDEWHADVMANTPTIEALQLKTRKAT